jgi:hypothetical protein
VVTGDFANLGSSARGTNSDEKLDIGLVIVCPLRRYVILVVDSLDWANWLTGTAVDALIRVNVKHAVALIDAVDRALFDAGLVFHV